MRSRVLVVRQYLWRKDVQNDMRVIFHRMSPARGKIKLLKMEPSTTTNGLPNRACSHAARAAFNFVLGTWYLVLGTWYLVLGTWYLVLGTWYLALGTWYLVLSTLYLVAVPC